MTPRDLYATPERLPLHLLEQALQAAIMVLDCEHPAIHEPLRKGDPPTLIAARRACNLMLKLRVLLRRYDDAVQDALGTTDAIPF